MSFLKWWSSVLVILAGIVQMTGKSDDCIDNAIILLLSAIWVLLLDQGLDKNDK